MPLIHWNPPLRLRTLDRSLSSSGICQSITTSGSFSRRQLSPPPHPLHTPDFLTWKFGISRNTKTSTAWRELTICKTQASLKRAILKCDWMCQQVIKGPLEINVIMEALHGELSGPGSDQWGGRGGGEHARSPSCLPSAAIIDRRKETRAKKRGFVTPAAGCQKTFPCPSAPLWCTL